MTIEILPSTREIDNAVSEQFAALMAHDLLMAGVHLSDFRAVRFELAAREYSDRMITALSDKAVATARRMKH